MKTLAILCLTLTSFTHAAQDKPALLPNPNITVEYDRFKDKTEVALSAQYTKITTSRNLRFVTVSANFSYPGRKIKRPIEEVAVGLTVYSYEPLYTIDRQPRVIVLADEKRAIDIEVSAFQPPPKGGTWYAIFLLTLSPKDLNTLIEAKLVEVQIGTVEFQITTQHQADLKALLLRAKP